MELLSELNEVQKEAVLYNDGPSLVIAGAGSGKTRVLTYKIACLLEQGHQPWHILALTFTNKSAREMKSRIAQLVGPELARNLWMGTFHSIFAKILRMEAAALELPGSFSIYDTNDSRSLLRSIIKELKLDDKTYKVNHIQYRISRAKNNLLLPHAYAQSQEVQQADMYNKVPLIKDIYNIYMQRCKQAGALDFDDILLFTNILFQKRPDILDKYRHRFTQILVDEYQDTNASQSLIVNKLAEVHRKICVVGDDAQSIYSFRGARIENILNFQSIFPDYKIFKLEQNYRSTQNIVNAADSLIKKNEGQIQKKIFSEKEHGDLIKLSQAYSDTEEGFIVANRITELRYAGCDYKDIAILYRTNAQSRIFEEALRKKNMPYKIYGGLSFFQRKEIKDLSSYFRLVVNTYDDEALKRIINYPARGIGATTMGRVQEAANTFKKSLWEIISSPLEFQLNITAGAQKKLTTFVYLIEEFRAQLDQLDAYALAYSIANSTGLLPSLYQDKSPQGVSSCENIEELLNSIQEFVEGRIQEGEAALLTNFVEEIALITDQDNEKQEDMEKVSMMTVHAAKGLEFRHVFIVGVEEELFPSAMAVASAKEIEEERRLFYVAITRAEETCNISFARSRYRFGTPSHCRPSRFLKDIDPRYLQAGEGIEAASPPRETAREQQHQPIGSARPMRSNSSPRLQPINRSTTNHTERATTENALQNETIQVGIMVEHERFGVGRIMALSGDSANRKARILFQNTGEKTLLLKFAKLHVIQE